MSAIRYTIGELSSRTGISTHTIRAWEKRYGAISPERTDSNQRLYSEDQLHRLQMIKQATDRKHPISRVAQLSDQDLSNLVTLIPSRVGQSIVPSSELDFVSEALAAIEKLNEEDLHHALRRSSASLGLEEMLDSVILPLLTEIGNRWETGSMRIFQEHLATSTIRTFLAEKLAALNPRIDTPRLIVTTPKNQMHEIGALLVGIAATIQNWNVVYLGPNLPFQEIADAAAKSRADAIALSIVFPLSDQDLAEELVNLRRLVGDSMPIFVGGSGIPSYIDTLHAIHATTFDHWRELRTGLGKIPA